MHPSESTVHCMAAALTGLPSFQAHHSSMSERMS